MAMIDLFVFAGGVALGVYGHDWIMKTFMSAEAYANKMKAKADAAIAVVKK